jgi:glycine betaine/proline transport system ATP-binding protein
MSEAKVSIKNLYKIFGRKPADMVAHVENGVSKADLLENYGHILGLNNVSIDIAPRAIQVVMGLSGSGKSTLIRHINRLIEPTAGQVVVDGDDVLQMDEAQLRDFRRKKASMVFQKFALLPHRSVIDNVAYGLKIQGVDAGQYTKTAQHWIERVGLSGFENNFPAQLSGGMQQRVGLARALATDSELLLMDEAFSALDPLIRSDMQDILLGLQDELHKTIIFITHDLDEALKIGDNITILRDGAVVQNGRPQDIVMSPADDYVTDFIKDINKARVLQVSSVMGKEQGIKGPSLEANTLLEDAMQSVIDSKANGAVVTKNGKKVGTASLAAMVKAIARAEKTGDTETYR